MKKSVFVILSILLLQSGSYAAFFQPQGNPYEGMGYVGTLPDLTGKFQPTEPIDAKPVFEKTQKFNSEKEIKPIPRDNPAFVNIILKQDKTSPYINDLTEFIDMLEKIYDSIEENENVQRFAARVYFFNQNAEYFRQKYEDKPESNYISYEKLLELSNQAKTVSQLRSEAEKYSPYLAYSGSGQIYNSNNIDQQISYLKDEIEKTINILREAR